MLKRIWTALALSKIAMRAALLVAITRSWTHTHEISYLRHIKAKSDINTKQTKHDLMLSTSAQTTEYQRSASQQISLRGRAQMSSVEGKSSSNSLDFGNERTQVSEFIIVTRSTGCCQRRFRRRPQSTQALCASDSTCRCSKWSGWGSAERQIHGWQCCAIVDRLASDFAFPLQ